jgi:hypothetical protein
MDDFSGRVLVRMPTDLHARLAFLARQHNVSLNQYIVFLLSINQSHAVFNEQCQKEDLVDQFQRIKEESRMGQDTLSGRQGNEFGRKIGQLVAQKLGINLEPGSNKGRYEGRVVVIKSVRIGNSQFGITNKMAEEVNSVILAKEINNGLFELYKIEFKKIRSKGRPTRSKGSSSGKVTNFSVSEAINHGEKFDILQMSL